MISVLGNRFEQSYFLKQLLPGSFERKVGEILVKSKHLYVYDFLDQLYFEINLRKHIVKAANDLHKSKFSFKVFKNTKCNDKFWIRTREGGFLMREDVNPREAILDIYAHSESYGTECATAIVIVYLKALADLLPDKLFYQLFPSIYLMTWVNLDKDLGIRDFENMPDNLPGDCRYFVNPNVNPKTNEWQGENTIYFGDDIYYGHGMGVLTSAGIIAGLNKHRRKGAKNSAYLHDSAKRPNFKHLADKLYDFNIKGNDN